MSTIIYPSPIFGPIRSRRLGISLGINLLPGDGKVCTFDCIYCECGFNAERRPKQKLPTRHEVAEALEKKLVQMQAEGMAPDVLTFAGNGEPTAHPDFAAIIDDTLQLRDRYFPHAKVSVIMDDREEFAKTELFPGAEEVICGNLQNISDYMTIKNDDYVCVMTRGHAYDTVVQAQVLKCRPTYCGVIGSAFKAAGVRKTLKEEYGLLDEELDLVTTPIGLNIKGETPAEIAISIAAQMILHRAERNRL